MLKQWREKNQLILHAASMLLIPIAVVWLYYAMFPSHFKVQAADNNSFVLLASSARTATVSSVDQRNPGWQRVHVIVNVSAYTSGTWTPRIQGKDPASGSYYDILVGAPITSTGLTVIKAGPGLWPRSLGSTPDFVPVTWRVQMTGTATPSATFSVGVNIEQ